MVSSVFFFQCLLGISIVFLFFLGSCFDGIVFDVDLAFAFLVEECGPALLGLLV